MDHCVGRKVSTFPESDLSVLRGMGDTRRLDNFVKRPVYWPQWAGVAEICPTTIRGGVGT